MTAETLVANHKINVVVLPVATSVVMSESSLLARARLVIPHGVYGHQGVGRGLPPGYPQFYREAGGCHLVGEDGRVYTDYMCGYGPNILGYGDTEVEDRVRRQAETGMDWTRPRGPAG